MRRLSSGLIYALSTAIGLLAFIYPFFSPLTRQIPASLAHSQDAPLVTAGLVVLSLAAMIVELQGQTLSAKTVAMLGVMVAVTSVLRFIGTAVPLPGGFSPIFAPIILGGFVFGGRFGFLLGAFTLLTSALMTGGVGPWLPYQMFTAGWVGLSSGALGRLNRRYRAAQDRLSTAEVWGLALFGLFWGLVYGAIMNLYFWPYAVGSSDQIWDYGISLGETLARYGAFYLATSLWWDAARGIGNLVLLLILARATVRALRRFQRSFHYEVS